MAGGIFFVTGRLAAPSLEQVLRGVAERGGPVCEALELPISVAALMTPSWALARIEGMKLRDKPEKIVMPGRVSGDLRAMGSALGVPVERGPEDLWDIPAWLGLEGNESELPDVIGRPKIVAEIVDAWRMSPAAVLERAEAFRRDGADFVDLGGSPDAGIPDITEKVGLLKKNDFKVSVDTFHAETMIAACDAGADMLLSVNSSNLELLDRIKCPLVVIPDFDDEGHLDSLEKNVEAVRRAGRTAIADPILAPPLMGFVTSLCRFLEYRSRYPEVPMLMGAGNVTELLEADSTGVNALLAACLYETGVDYVLTTEVAEWARGTVRELSLACRIMATAGARNSLPRRISRGLRPLKAQGSKYGIETLRRMCAGVTDDNWRIFVAEGRICAFNKGHFLCGEGAGEIFAAMEVGDPPHAFYLGRELQKAAIALELGRDYVQDNPLTWGVLS